RLISIGHVACSGMGPSTIRTVSTSTIATVRARFPALSSAGSSLHEGDVVDLSISTIELEHAVLEVGDLPRDVFPLPRSDVEDVETHHAHRIHVHFNAQRANVEEAQRDANVGRAILG